MESNKLNIAMPFLLILVLFVPNLNAQSSSLQVSFALNSTIADYGTSVSSRVTISVSGGQQPYYGYLYVDNNQTYALSSSCGSFSTPYCQGNIFLGDWAVGSHIFYIKIVDANGKFGFSQPITVNIYQIPNMKITINSSNYSSAAGYANKFIPGQSIQLQYKISGGVKPYSTEALLDCSYGSCINGCQVYKKVFYNTSQVTIPNLTGGACFIQANVTDSIGVSEYNTSTFSFDIIPPPPPASAQPEYVNPSITLSIFIISILAVVILLLKTQKGKRKGIWLFVGAILLILGINFFFDTLMYPPQICTYGGYYETCSFYLSGTMISIVIEFIIGVIGFFLIKRNSKHQTVQYAKNLKVSYGKVDNEDKPLKTLKHRYAKGEITKKQYLEMKKDLEG